MRLTVHQGYDFDNYKDVIRVHNVHRAGVKSGRLVRVRTDKGGSTVAAVRGLNDEEKSWTRMDLETRRRLKVELGEEHHFTIRKAWWWEKLCWAASSSDPTARVATWIGIWLGGFGIVLSIIQIWQALKN